MGNGLKSPPTNATSTMCKDVTYQSDNALYVSKQLSNKYRTQQCPLLAFPTVRLEVREKIDSAVAAPAKGC